MADEKVIKIDAKVTDPAADAFKRETQRVSSSADKILNDALEDSQKGMKDLLKNIERMNKQYEYAERRRAKARQRHREKMDDIEGNDTDSGIKKALNNFQKVITAMNGTNGRVTKVMAVVKRAYDILEDRLHRSSAEIENETNNRSELIEKTKTLINTIVKLKNAGIQELLFRFRDLGGNIGKSADAVVDTFRKMQEKAKQSFDKFADKFSGTKMAARIAATISNLPNIAANVSKALLGLGVAAGIVAASILAMEVATKLITKTIESMEDIVQNFSAKLNAQKGVNTAKEAVERINSAKKIGGTLSSLEESRGQLQREMIKIHTSLTRIGGPLVKIAAEILGIVLKILNFLLTIPAAIMDAAVWLFSKTTEMLMELLKDIPLIGRAVEAYERWRKASEAKALLEAQNESFQMMEGIFDANQFGVRKPKNPKPNSPESFLP